MFILLTLCIILSLACPGMGYAHMPEENVLNFTVIDWAYEVRDQGDYDRNSTGAFPKGERAYAYLELTGFTCDIDDNFYFTDVHVDVALKTKKGLKLFSRKDVLIMDSYYIETPDILWFYIYVDVPWWAGRGEYKAELIIRDEVVGETLAVSKDIEIY